MLALLLLLPVAAAVGRAELALDKAAKAGVEELGQNA